MSGMSIRAVREADVAAMLAIYRPFVERSTVSFEYEPPTLAEFGERVRAVASAHAWLVAEIEGQVAGYAYGGSHRLRAAYRWSAEVSAYVAEGCRGQGVARALYEQLFDRLAARGYCNALAVITLPNDGSVRFHECLGFRPVGVFRRGGWKFGAWHDVGWFQRELRDHPPAGS